MSNKKDVFVNCDDCPCLNNDYEQGGSCNLGYMTDLQWADKKTNEIVDDTPEMRSHQDDFYLFYGSKDCKLQKVVSDTVYIPQRLEVKE